jgi:hypothetical protein
MRVVLGMGLVWCLITKIVEGEIFGETKTADKRTKSVIHVIFTAPWLDRGWGDCAARTTVIYIYIHPPSSLWLVYIYIYLQPVSYSMSLPRFYDDHSRSNSSEREIYICCQIYSSVEGLPYILKLLFIVFKLNRTHLDNIKKGGPIVSKESKYHFEKIEK